MTRKATLTPEERRIRAKASREKYRKTHPDKIREIQRNHSRRKQETGELTYNPTTYDKAKANMRSKKRRYKITEEEYNKMVDESQGLCKICGNPDRLGKALSIDHDHKTGIIRGLICSDCNRGLGGFMDSIDRLQSAIRYLRNF